VDITADPFNEELKDEACQMTATFKDKESMLNFC
jgi:hypothetical protein